MPTIAGELSNERRRISTWRKDLAAQVDQEALLREALEARTAAAESLALQIELLAIAWKNGTGHIERWIDQARRVSNTKLFAGRRRRRIGERYAQAIMAAGGDPESLRRRLADDANAFDALVSFAVAERVVRESRKDADSPPDQDLDRSGLELATRSQELSRKLVQSFVAGCVTRARAQLEARTAALVTGKEPQRTQRELMKELPGWAITTHSILQLRRDPAMFDLVIVDEASQCSIPAVLPLLFRAKRALIIGDTKQLAHIAPLPKHHERLARERAGLSASWLEERQLSYGAHSAYHAGSHVSGRPLLLDEHYRCHPAIVGVVNDYCYNGRLEVLTDVRALRRVPAPATSERWVLAWEDVDGTPRPGDNGRSWFNDAEIDRVCDVVGRLLTDLSPEADIGVITPFRAHQERLEAALRAQHRSEATRRRVQIGTVHQFQGGARDAMVLSLVANDKAPKPTIDWVASQLNLWNVAITRARSHLVTVGARSFWSQQPGIPAQLAKSSPRLPPDAWPTAVAPLDGVTAGDPLMDQMHAQLIQAGHGDIERDALLDGYRCDFIFGRPDEPTTVILDRGARDGHDAARHMRLMLTRCRLLADVAGDVRSNGTVARAIRVPAWRVLAGAGIPQDGA